jgi:hypothetical protein
MDTAGYELPRKRLTSSDALVLGDGVRLPAATSSAGTSTTSPLNTANILAHLINQPT